MRAPALFAAVISFVAHQVTFAADRPLILTIQVRPDASPKTLATIARIGVPNEVVTSGPATVKSLLSDEYGSSHQKLRRLFAKYNPAVKTETIRPGTTVKLPAGPMWIFNVAKRTTSTLNALDLAKVEMGVSGPKTVRKIAEINKISASAVPTIRGGESVTLPYIAPFVSIEVKPEFKDTARQVVHQLQASDQAVQSAEVSEAYDLIGALASNAAAAGSGGTPKNCRLPSRDSLSKLPGTRITLAVIDSGIVPNDSRFDDLWKNPRLGSDGYDLDFSFLRDDLNGFDFVNWQAFPADDVPSYHGTHVAGIATQRLADAMHGVINARIDLMVLKVADANGHVVQGPVENAVSFAIERGVRVANMSFAGKPSASLQVKFRDARDVLFVIAAGNDGLDADKDETKVYPAKFAAKLPNVISVAALGSDDIASGSNFGHRSVDIAAPGIDIASTVGGETRTALLSGSSQAAPLVAFTAALLASCGFKTPEAVRWRILDSADVLPSLRNKVACEGVVDPEKALSFDTDIIELSDQTLKRGMITRPVSISLSNGKAIPMDQVRKIVFNYSSEPAQALRITWSTDNKRFTEVSGNTLQNITFTHDGIDETINIANLRDIVRRSPI